MEINYLVSPYVEHLPQWVKRKITEFKIAAAFYGLIVLSNFAILFLVDSIYLEYNKHFNVQIDKIHKQSFNSFIFRILFPFST